MSSSQDVSREAGRELDALVAERVMGLKVIAHVGGFDGRQGWHDDFGFGNGYVRNPPRWPATPQFPDDYNFERVPAYSTDIAAAWEVVEKLDAEPHGLAATIESDGTGKWWGATFWQGDTFYSGQAETAPLAICLAALQAVVRVPGDTQKP